MQLEAVTQFAVAAAIASAIATATAFAGAANAGSARRVADTYVAEGRGCYWHRGAMTCARYCYLEVDGRRYCQRRSREAFPQGMAYFWGEATGERPSRYRPNVEVAPDYRGRPWVVAPRRDVE
jgi:hypothetical protein